MMNGLKWKATIEQCRGEVKEEARIRRSQVEQSFLNHQTKLRILPYPSIHLPSQPCSSLGLSFQRSPCTSLASPTWTSYSRQHRCSPQPIDPREPLEESCSPTPEPRSNNRIWRSLGRSQRTFERCSCIDDASSFSTRPWSTFLVEGRACCWLHQASLPGHADTKHN